VGDRDAGFESIQKSFHGRTDAIGWHEEDLSPRAIAANGIADHLSSNSVT
jgi:hypothetical protein